MNNNFIIVELHVGYETMGPVAQRVDSIHVVCFVNTYPLDSDLSGG